MRSLPDPGFAADTGTAPPALAAVLAESAVDGARSPVLAVLAAAQPPTRLLVPVLAATGDDAAGGHEGDVSTVLMRGVDGRLALLAFTSTTAMAAWRPAARPVPATVRSVAEAALAEGASAVVVDVAGPVVFVVETAELIELAAGHRLLPAGTGYGWFASWPGAVP